MNNEGVNIRIEKFVREFNLMCESSRKDFLVRERVVEYEYGSRLKTYQVKYKLKHSRNTWKIIATTSGFWLFRRKFPLLKIRKKENKIQFSGLYTQAIPEFDVQLIDEKLQEYMAICKNLPQNVFTKS